MPQRILVLGASGYIGQHLVRALSAQGHQILAAARRIERLENSNWLTSVVIKSISTGRIICPRCSARSTPSIIWCMAWAKAAILLPMSARLR